MICQNCQTVNPENARFCIECGQPLPRACPNCGTINPPNARFCFNCGTPLQTQTAARTAPIATSVAVPDPVPAPVTALAVPAVAEAPAPITTGATSGGLGTATEQTEERRIVTVLFADITSSTTLADGMDPEDVRSLLAGFFSTMAREIHRHGGTVEKYIGDAVMAVFGLPVAHEDDPLRAVRAGLDMQAALLRYNEGRRESDPGAPELQMRIGINTGDVVAASGQAEGRDFLITGDPVNVAARLQQTAAPGSILVGPRTYRGTSGAVVYRQLPPITLRGKPRPVPVWEVVEMVGEGQGQAPLPRPRGVQGLRAPLIGRDVELELLRTLYSRVTNERRPHLITIVGVPGVGKTRLAREFLAQTLGNAEMDEARRPLVLEGRCPPYGESITYWPLAEMLRVHCEFSALDAPETARAKLLACVREVLSQAGRPDDPELLAAYLGHTIGIESRERRRALLPTEPQQLQDGVWRAWRTLFEALAARHPLLALVDDIHWADDALLELLEYVAGRATDVPLLLLCPARPELLERRPGWGGGKRNYATIGLEPLSQRDTERLLRELLPEAPESLRAGILDKAEGNPFYVEEITRMLVDRGILVHSRDEEGVKWHVAPEWEESDEVTDPAIPDTVQGVLAARLDLLSDDERDILRHAAVIGRFFWPSALRRLHPQLSDDDLFEVLDALRDKDLIRESERPEATLAPAGEPLYTFNHALTREVTYAGIPRTRRAREHERVAVWVEEQARGREAEFADILAQHYRQFYVQGGLARSRNAARRQQIREKVVRYLTLAGDQSETRHAAAKAERYYADALALLAEDPVTEDVPRRVELLMKRGDARWLQVRPDEAWADYRESLRLWAAYSMVTVERESSDGATAAGTISAPIAADGAPPLLAQMPSASGSTRLQVALPPGWRIWGLRLYRLLVQLPTRSGGLFQQAPAHEELLPLLEEGLRLADELGQRDTLAGAQLLTAKAFFWWSYTERRGEDELLDALRSAREAVRITERLEDARAASEALDALGNMQATTTDLSGSLESQTRRLVWARRLDDTTELVDISSEVCTAYTLAGQYATAIEHGSRALALAEAAEVRTLTARALRSLVVAFSDWDHWPETIEMGKRFVAMSARTALQHSDAAQWALLAYATAHARMGQRDESDRAAQMAGQPPMQDCGQLVDLYRARLALARGAEREARQLLLAALEAQSGRVALPALLAELAELGARGGDRDLYERFGAQAQELGWRSGARKALAQAIRARGIVAIADGRWDDALGDLESALNRYREMETSWEEARTRYALAGCYRRRNASGDDERAREELRTALQIYDRLHAVRDIARARAALAGGDVRLP